jgi:purine-binding chemotaxis protein CheW
MEESTITSETIKSDKEKAMQLVGFMIGSELFGVNILSVQEIIRTTPITPIPDSPDFIEGVINLRGNIIPVIDLRKRLNLLGDGFDENNLWIVILNVDNRVTGFIVDRVTQVLKIHSDIIKPPPDIVVAGLQSQYISGVCKINDNLLILLDFNQILQIDEIKKLKALRSNGIITQGEIGIHNHQAV